MMSDELGTREFVVRVNGKELGTHDLLCTKLFTARVQNIEMFPLVVRHRFEVCGVPFFFEVPGCHIE
jgi:hypothetical protein